MILVRARLRPIGFNRRVLISNLPTGRFSPCSSPPASCSQLCSLRLDAFAIAANGPAEPIGTLLTRRRHTTNLTWPARSRRLRRANFAPLSLVALLHAEQRRLTGRLS
jgi:hypothetical protein